jgi:hypothetical protein
MSGGIEREGERMVGAREMAEIANGPDALCGLSVRTSCTASLFLERYQWFNLCNQLFSRFCTSRQRE